MSEQSTYAKQQMHSRACLHAKHATPQGQWQQVDMCIWALLIVAIVLQVM
jgi:hypothetical protein